MAQPALSFSIERSEPLFCSMPLIFYQIVGGAPDA
jgi:hypothetical protein